MALVANIAVGVHQIKRRFSVSVITYSFIVCYVLLESMVQKLRFGNIFQVLSGGLCVLRYTRYAIRNTKQLKFL